MNYTAWLQIYTNYFTGTKKEKRKLKDASIFIQIWNKHVDIFQMQHTFTLHNSLPRQQHPQPLECGYHGEIVQKKPSNTWYTELGVVCVCTNFKKYTKKKSFVAVWLADQIKHLKQNFQTNVHSLGLDQCHCTKYGNRTTLSFADITKINGTEWNVTRLCVVIISDSECSQILLKCVQFCWNSFWLDETKVYSL